LAAQFKRIAPGLSAPPAWFPLISRNPVPSGVIMIFPLDVVVFISPVLTSIMPPISNEPLNLPSPLTSNSTVGSKVLIPTTPPVDPENIAA